MVTLLLQNQQNQQTELEENRYQKDQDRDQINLSIDDSNLDNVRNKTVPYSESVTAVTGNGSVTSSITQCSDIENDDEEEEEEEEEDEEAEDEGEWIPDLPVPKVLQHQEIFTADGNVLLPNAETANFGDVCVKNSTNVHLGNKTFYKGPVTIKQFVYTNPSPICDSDTTKSDNNRTSNGSAFDLSNIKGDSVTNSSTLSQNPELDKVTKWLWSWRCAAFVCVLALILVTVVIIACVYLTRSSTIPPAPVFPEIPDSSSGENKVINVRFVERNEWGAQPPSEPLTKMKLPVPYVIISHTVTDFCTTQSECVFHVRFAQTFHIESRKWSDIAYNFLVGGDGLIYVGRSWDYMGAHSAGFNNVSIGISFIGTFNSVIPPKNQLNAAQHVIELGVKRGKIAANYTLLGHRQVSSTLSPGDALYSIIKTWPHWSPRP